MIDHVSIEVSDLSVSTRFYQTLLKPLNMHICLRAPNKTAVDDFYHAALENGGTGDGRPGMRTQYTHNYYAAFIRDPDGNRIEAVTFVG